MSDRLAVLEALAIEEEKKLRDRFPIGYARGLSAAVLTVRAGESLDNCIANSRERIRIGVVAFPPTSEQFPVDSYDRGWLAALEKAKEIMEQNS